MSEKNTVQDLINNLKLINDKSDKKIVLPQSKLSVGLKSLQAKHVSKINSSLLASMSQSVKKTVFNKLVEQIFTDILTLPDGVDYNSFTVIDYYYILFTIRESINPIFKIQGDDDNDVSVNITEKLNVYRKTKFKLTLPKVGKKPCEVYLKVPTYKLMRRFEDITHERQVAEEKKGEKNFDMESIMKDMFSFSIIPYIEKIKTVVDGDEPSEIIFNELTLSQKVQILDLIPSELYKNIIEGIGKLNSPIDELLSTDTPDIKIPLDQTFLVDND